MDERDDELMSMFNNIMARVTVLYEQYPALFAMCVQISLLAVIFICLGMRCQRTMPLRLRDTASHDAARLPQVFDRALNINFNMRQGIGPAPGTPDNPLGIATDDEDEIASPSHLLGGARSKAKAKPGPRRSGSASSPNEPTNDASSTTTEAETVMCPVLALQLPDARGSGVALCVATTFRKCYHRVSCFKLDNCNDVRYFDPDDAIARGLRLCKKCNA